MFRQYRDIFERIENVREDIRKTIFMREQLIETFNQSLGGLRLSMRLRKRSGGLLAWRNIATRSSKQRDYDLLHYRDDLGRLPQTVRNQLLQFDKQRILLNLNWSMLQHESKQLNQAAKKIEANTTVIEPMLS
ncbi:MAG: DUF3158 family protein [Gammaproteobacteria bacterium]|nr:DUF3158 family protein [Gammaproteobacteria bacterium]